MAFTEMTRQRAEAIIREMVKAGQIPRTRAEESIDELVERSRQNSEALVTLIQDQLREQLPRLGLATKDDVGRLEAKIDELIVQARKLVAPGKSAAKRTTATKRASAVKPA